MPPFPRIPFLLVACALVSLAACGGAGVASPPSEGTLQVRSVTIDAPANPEVAAVRLVVDNQTSTPDALRSVTTPEAETVSLHRSGEDARGRAVMAEVDDVPIAARSRVRFEPGGLHVMLTGLRSRIVAGDTVRLRFHFREAGIRTVDAKVVPLGSAGEHGHDS